LEIYGITPGFDTPFLLDRIKSFFDQGHSLLQIRDKSACKNKTSEFIESLLIVADSYSHIKIIINISNNYSTERKGQGFVQLYNLHGIHDSPGNRDFRLTPITYENKFNFLSCHTQKDLLTAKDSGFDAVTLSSVFRTKSHPEETRILGLENFRKICENYSELPIFALGGINRKNMHLFEDINCMGVSMISDLFIPD